MGLFGGGSSQHDNDVEGATSEKNTTEQWGAIMDVCDKAGKSAEDAKNYLKAILKRLGNTDPHVAIQAVTLLDACARNSGKTFRLELASREFENQYHQLLMKSHPKVGQKLKEALRKWVEETEFKNDPQLNLIPSLYANLKSKGTDFSVEMPTKKPVQLSKDPNVVQSQEEEDQIAKAIELSLKETSGSPRNSTNTASSALYPSANLGNVPMAASVTPQKEERKVRALYDFEAAEDNELTFSSGEIIFVMDDSDPNWWKGRNQRGEGLFPANFVTPDLNLEPEQLVLEKKKKLIELDEDLHDKARSAAAIVKEPENIEIDEDKINRLIHLLHEADPTNPDQDTQEMLNLEREVNCMGPLIDAELERVDRKHAQLTKLSSDLVESFSLYHQLMKEPQFPSLSKMPYMSYNPYHPSGMQRPAMYNGSMGPPSMGPPSMGPPNMGPQSMGAQSMGPQSMVPTSMGPPSMGPQSMMGPNFNSIPPGQDRQYMTPHNMPHFPPGMTQLRHPHQMGSMPPMPSLHTHGIPPGHSIIPHGQPMPPGVQQDMHRMPQTSIPGGNYPQQELPNFGPGSIPQNYPQNGPHLIQPQNGPLGSQSALFPQTSNTHIM